MSHVLIPGYTVLLLSMGHLGISEVGFSTIDCISLINRGSYMSAHVLLNLLNELGEKEINARLTEHFISFSQQV